MDIYDTVEVFSKIFVNFKRVLVTHVYVIVCGSNKIIKRPSVVDIKTFRYTKLPI